MPDLPECLPEDREIPENLQEQAFPLQREIAALRALDHSDTITRSEYRQLKNLEIELLQLLNPIQEEEF